MKRWMLGLGLAASMALACGCSSKDDDGNSLVVSGQVAPTSKGFDNPRAIAISSTGVSYWAYLDTAGRFSLTVPKGQSYRVLIANSLPGGGHGVIGHLVLDGATGKTRWLSAASGGTLSLGVVGKNPNAAAATTHALSDGDKGSVSSGSGGGDDKSKSSSSDKEGDDDRDTSCHEDEHEHEHLCGGSEKDDDSDGDDELECDKDHKVEKKFCDDKDDDDDKDKSDKEKCDKEVSKPCTGGAGGGGGGTTTPPGGGSGGSAPSVPPATPSGGSGGLNATCTVNSDCAVGLGCFSSKCSPIIK